MRGAPVSPTVSRLATVNLSDYHAHPAWSSSRKKSAATRTMLSYWAEYEDPNRKPKTPTESMRRGSLVDAYITEDPNSNGFLDRYFILPEDAPKRPTATQLKARNPKPETLIQIEYWERVDAQSQGKEIITKADFNQAHAIYQRLLNDADTSEVMLQEVICSQQPHFWTNEHEIECRYLPDIETADGGLWDLKLTRSAKPHLFRAQAYSLGYDIQLAHYREGYINKHGTEPSTVGIIAYEWDWPHNCCVFVADDELLEHGAERGDQAVRDVLACRESGVWPSYGRAALKLPRYADFANPDNDTNPDDLGLEGLADDN